MKQSIIRVWAHAASRLVSEIVLIAGSVGLVSMSMIELVKSFTVYRGYEVGLVRVTALLVLLVAAAMAYLGVKLIRSSGRPRASR